MTLPSSSIKDRIDSFLRKHRVNSAPMINNQDLHEDQIIDLSEDRHAFLSSNK